ncbi:MAG TPA: hypothetical protein VIY48_00745 [Candidatus Paceibacterota bacterium]
MTVSSQIRELCHQQAKAACKALGIEPDKFNQDACALSCLMTLQKVKTNEEKAQVCYIHANASALRQALTSTKEQKGAQIATALVNALKGV